MASLKRWEQPISPRHIVHERDKSSLYNERQVLSLGVDGIVRVTPLHCHRIDEIDKFLKITAEIAAL